VENMLGSMFDVSSRWPIIVWNEVAIELSAPTIPIPEVLTLILGRRQGDRVPVFFIPSRKILGYNLYIHHNNVLYYTPINKKFWEELIAYFPLIRHGSHRKLCLQQSFVAAETCLPSRCLATIGGYTDRPTGSPFIRHGQHRTILLLLRVFVNTRACLRSRYLAMMGGGDTHPDTQTARWFHKPTFIFFKLRNVG
jgi:hypothetical protein